MLEWFRDMLSDGSEAVALARTQTTLCCNSYCRIIFGCLPEEFLPCRSLRPCRTSDADMDVPLMQLLEAAPAPVYVIVRSDFAALPFLSCGPAAADARKRRFQHFECQLS